eukprot:NODE_6736_length_821_cov_100.018625_g6500_i0.p1 GENE.NODE_6736_length_821_cov_100.018625_g6500_i0~~NODE_6736_length_821_cov_100.018625_g6500_i0.p1  ORF type:complete len:255 (-),score=12.34 NODE_6736_length_821_cov_100.018625_g6500_i0:4-768(-)
MELHSLGRPLRGFIRAIANQGTKQYGLLVYLAYLLATILAEPNCGPNYGGAVCGTCRCCSSVGWCGGDATTMTGIHCDVQGFTHASPVTPGTHWYQLDLGSTRSIAGVVTQARSTVGEPGAGTDGSDDEYVITYKVSISSDNSIFVSVDGGAAFAGNTFTGQGRVQALFTVAVSGRYVRLFPFTWNAEASWRVGILCCVTLTPTATPTRTATATTTSSATRSASPTRTRSASNTRTRSASNTRTRSASNTRTLR